MNEAANEELRRRITLIQASDCGNKLTPMKTTRIEITVESSRLVIMHQPGALQEAWCVCCGKQVGAIRLEESTLSGISGQAVRQQLDAGILHYTGGLEETRLLCLESLAPGKAERREGQHDHA